MLLLVGLAQASPIEFYGFGGPTLGRAGAGMALPQGPASVLANSAALPGIRHPQLTAGFVGVQAQFDAVPDVWWDTNQDGLLNDSDPPLQVDTDYDPIEGFMLGATVPFGPTIAVGLATFLPVERIIRLETFEPAIPTYFLYENRSQCYEFGAAAGWRPKWGLAIGVGAQMIPRASYSLDATLDVTVSGASGEDSGVDDVVSGTMDVHRMTLDLVWGFSPNVSLHWDVGQAIPALDGLQLGAQWRGEAGLPVDVSLNLQVNAKTTGMGDADDLVLPLLVAMNLGVFDHYLPEQLSFGGAYTFADTLTVTADVRRTAWDRAQVNIAKVTHISVTGAAVDLGDDQISDGNPYDLTLRPTWSERLGVDLALPKVHVSQRLGDLQITPRGGIGYEPTPLEAQTADSALLDADRILFGIGLGFEGQDPFRKPDHQRTVRLDGFFQYHVLATGSLDRGTPDSPTAGYAVDGSPIPIGGHLFAAGAELGVEY